MLEFLVDNIFVVFAGKVFQQTIGIPMGTNCAPLLADIFLYSYEADFIQYLLSTGKKHLASRFNLTYRYIDDVLSINNPEFEIIWARCILLNLRSRTPQRVPRLASYLDLLLSIGRDGQLYTSIYDKRDDFNFHITNFPFRSSVVIQFSLVIPSPFVFPIFGGIKGLAIYRGAPIMSCNKGPYVVCASNEDKRNISLFFGIIIHA